MFGSSVEGFSSHLPLPWIRTHEDPGVGGERPRCPRVTAQIDAPVADAGARSAGSGAAAEFCGSFPHRPSAMLTVMRALPQLSEMCGS